MSKFTKVLPAFLCLVVLLCATVACSGSSDNTLRYAVTPDDNGNPVEASCAGYRHKNATEAVIEATYEGVPVTYISQGAFKNNKKLASVTIPNSVITIDYGAFEGCTSLTDITIPESVTTFDAHVFVGCTSLENVTILSKEVKWIGGFEGCTSLKKINIPEGVEGITDAAFTDCSSLTSIVIPKNVTSFGVNVFYGCSSLSNIYFTGSKEEWAAIKGIADAAIPENVTIHYNAIP